MLEIEPLLQRLPKDLFRWPAPARRDGRAVNRHADIFLLDEPLSNLDAALRSRCAASCRGCASAATTRLRHATIGRGDDDGRRLVCSRRARRAVRAPLEIYHRPRRCSRPASWVARMNFLRGEIAAITQRASRSSSATAPTVTRRSRRRRKVGDRGDGRRATGASPGGRRAGPRQATVQLVEDLGDTRFMHLDSTDGRTWSRSRRPPPRKARPYLELPADECHVFRADKKALPRLQS